MSQQTLPSFKGTFDIEQTEALLNPINPRRVHQADGQSHVPFFEVTAHLIRLFGFGNFATEILEQELIFEEVLEVSKQGQFEYGPRNSRATAQKADNPHTWRWNVCYRATVRLTIFDRQHNLVTQYENSSTGDASNQSRADGHDLALKSAISLATKRCAINLGDQFGLSLYNKGDRNAIVMRSKVLPKDYDKKDEDTADPSEGVKQVQGEGIDEVEKVGPSDDAPTPGEAQANLANGLGAQEVDPSTTEAQAADGTARDNAKGQRR